MEQMETMVRKRRTMASTMIHGDLHPGHIMVDNRVTGLIDWTEATHSDPSMDFIGHHRVFDDEGLEQLITAYGKAGGEIWPRIYNRTQCSIPNVYR